MPLSKFEPIPTNLVFSPNDIATCSICGRYPADGGDSIGRTLPQKRQPTQIATRAIVVPRGGRNHLHRRVFEYRTRERLRFQPHPTDKPGHNTQQHHQNRLTNKRRPAVYWAKVPNTAPVRSAKPVDTPHSTSHSPHPRRHRTARDLKVVTLRDWGSRWWQGICRVELRSRSQSG